MSPKVFICTKKFFQIWTQQAKIYQENIITFTGDLGPYSFTYTIQSVFVVGLNLMNDQGLAPVLRSGCP